MKIYGGKGMLWGKKIHYAVYQHDYDEKKWTPLGHLGPAGSSERRLHEGSKACFRMKGSLIEASRDTSDERLDGEEYVGRKASSRIRYGPNTSRAS